MAGKLTPKQQAFVQEYLVDLNATQAAIRAGYSPKTAYRTGADNLKKPQIAEAISGAQQERGKRLQVDADEVLERLTAIARGEVRTEKATKFGVLDLPPDFGERIRALELVGKHLGMFTERVDVTSGGEKLKGPIVNVYLPENGRGDRIEGES